METFSEWFFQGIFFVSDSGVGPWLSIHEIEIVSETNEMLCVRAYGKKKERKKYRQTDRRIKRKKREFLDR